MYFFLKVHLTCLLQVSGVLPGGDAYVKRTASAELRERAEHSTRDDATVRVGSADGSAERC